MPALGRIIAAKPDTFLGTRMANANTAADKFGAAVSRLTSELTAVDKELSLDSRSNPEDQLKAPIARFLEDAGASLIKTIRITTEHRQSAGDVVEGVRLDMAIKRGRGKLVGHIELKSPAKSANPYRKTGWTKHDRGQWEKLEHHPNLVYSNGWEWTLLRHGAGKPLVHVLLQPDGDGAVPESQVDALKQLLEQFLSWKPLAPSSPKVLADQLAPLTAFLRDSVVDVLEASFGKTTGLPALYQKWQADLMPGATHKDFADSFAQTFTYALLLARIESDRDDESFTASSVTNALLRNGHKLIGSVLELMAQPANRSPVEGPVSLLESSIGAVDPSKLASKVDPWLYFYEDFLAVYDPKMRNDAGVYYTPVEVVRMQVRLLDEILRTRFGRQRGLGADDVNVLDPAIGTGAYALAVAEHVLSNSASPQSDSRSLSKRLFGFELLVGPYSVAHLRLTQMLESTGVDLGSDGVQVFLTNTLTDPGDISDDYQQISFWEIEQNLNEETRRAGLVKNQQTQIRVILGNPPYDRGSKQKALGVGSTKFRNVILEKIDDKPPLLDDFINPLKNIGAGGQAKNLYNSYVYFIRWGIWKACEQDKNDPGIVSFITSSSYLRGPGFAGMREYMLRVFDELWIVDLGGEGRGSRKEENVFAIQTPVAIFFGIQREKNSAGNPKKHSDRIKQKAQVQYMRITGSSRDKLDALEDVQAPDVSGTWTKVTANDWHSNFVPNSAGSLTEFIPLDWVLPWSQSGAQYKRKWPIAAAPEALEKRWYELFKSGVDPVLFVEDRDLTVDSMKTNPITLSPLPALSTPELQAQETMVSPVRYGYRSFDRQWCLPDHRVGTYIRQQFWDSLSGDQLYFVSLASTRLSTGPAMTVSPYVPDMDFFSNRGAKDVHPLYRTSDTSAPNISNGLLRALADCYGEPVSPEEVSHYVFGLLGTGAYTKRFKEELSESAARVPITNDYSLFITARDFGRSLIFEQTWGERCGELNQFGQPARSRFKGVAQIESETPLTPYPERWSYDYESHQLSVGDGIFSRVSPEVMEYDVSGMKVVNSWLGYRMRVPAGKSSSPLDRIQPESWSLDRELLELLWMIEFFINAESEGAEVLDSVVNGELIPVERIGPPRSSEMKAPKKRQPGFHVLL